MMTHQAIPRHKGKKKKSIQDLKANVIPELERPAMTQCSPEHAKKPEKKRTINLFWIIIKMPVFYSPKIYLSGYRNSNKQSPS